MRPLEEVTQALKKFKDSSAAPIIKRYMSSRLDFFGLKVPLQRKIVKQGFSFYEKSDLEILNIWDEIWNTSNNFDVMSLPLFYYSHPSRSHNLEMWTVLQRWTTRIENWAHSDYFSKIVADLLEDHPKMIFPKLKQWNQSKRPWERRVSLVGLLAFGARGRKTVLPFAVLIKLVKNLLRDSDVFVQKGVGWSLREIGQVYPAQTRAFIRRHVYELTSVAFASAVEKWSVGEKEVLRRQRQHHRKQKNRG